MLSIIAYNSNKIYQLFILILNVQSIEEKKNIPINSNTYYHREMKLVPINMDYYLLQFDALKFVLGVRLCKGLPNFDFSMRTPKFHNEIV